MDVGLVCDACRTFNPMGDRACARCGQSLSLDARGAGSGVKPAAKSSAAPAPTAAAVGKPKAPAPASGGPTPGGPQPMTTTPGAAAVCKSCGTPLNPSFQFCGSCGTPVETRAGGGGASKPAPSVSPAAMAARAAPGAPLQRESSGKKTLFFGAMQASRAKLTLIKGDGLDGVSFTLAGEEHLAGRGQDVPLMFAEDPFMSPVHANFFYRSNKLVVRDEKSVNGVYIRIRGGVPMSLGDRFLIGEQVIQVDGIEGLSEPMRPSADGTYFYGSPAQPRFRIVQLLRGGDTGLAFQAPGDVVSLGREGNDVNFPDDPFISGHHAQVSYANGSLSLTDLGSKNGTFLRVAHEAALEHGDYVFMGQQLLRVEIV